MHGNRGIPARAPMKAPSSRPKAQCRLLAPGRPARTVCAGCFRAQGGLARHRTPTRRRVLQSLSPSGVSHGASTLPPPRRGRVSGRRPSIHAQCRTRLLRVLHLYGREEEDSRPVAPALFLFRVEAIERSGVPGSPPQCTSTAKSSYATCRTRRRAIPHDSR